MILMVVEIVSEMFGVNGQALSIDGILFAITIDCGCKLCPESRVEDYSKSNSGDFHVSVFVK